MKRRYLHTITDADVGQMYANRTCSKCGHETVINFTCSLGRVMLSDVGKRVYEILGIIQVESSEQRDRRLQVTQASS